ncbi:MAG TPA: lysylphosphatidylglycerol synthase transmembrane domain-containing protein [Patescibacteria group bacterium]|nr:lysylphosphatidylglycerol synthase transmembrane domain-containing protein [Patescibacteria group bacterium]
MKRIKGAARFAWRWIGPAVFVGLLWNTDMSQVREAWRHGRAGLLVAAAALNAVIILVKAWRWRRLMQLQDIHYGYGPAVRYYAIGSAMAAWTPGRLGDFSKALAVHRDRKVGLGRAASSVIADRLLDAVALAGVAAVGAAFLPGPNGIWLAAAGMVAMIVAAWFLFRTTRSGMGRRGAEKLVGRFGKIGTAGDEVGAALDGLVDLARPALGTSVLLTVAATLVTFLQGYLVARSLGINASFWSMSVALAAVSITSLLPVTVAGFGTREGTLLLFLGPGGIHRHQIIAFSLAYFVIISGSLALMGAAAWVMRPMLVAADDDAGRMAGAAGNADTKAGAGAAVAQEKP